MICKERKLKFMSEQIKVNEKEISVIKVLQEHGALTLAEINSHLATPVAIGTVSNAVNKGFIKVAEEKGVSISENKRPVNRYVFITEEAGVTGKGKAKTYTDSEKEIMAVLKDATEPMTLAAIGEALGRKLSAGSVSGICTAGNIKVLDKVMSITKYPSPVNKYIVGDVDYQEYIGK